ncbi:TIR domain-containing protein [Solirubrobacter ginsenosidimutans]|uniref:TIR domain-containing protein n=2 Tax=Solirubrobacter ginsenosidimutans TaxID=490573 RepID=A0A9X3N3R3_9ACTN|nr:TIR domain-containing protein [Solirubrobacter ginsenosidimutans]
MAEAFSTALARIGREHASRAYAPPPILFIVSDGEPTDASGDTIRAVAEEIRAADVVIVSCLLTDEDLTESRRLYGSPRPGWPRGARLMFECASQLPQRSPFDAYLIEHRWTVDPDARLFTQINQSEVLTEFSKVILSPLEPSDRKPAQALVESPVRVFVTYSHQDAHYLADDSLLGYLSPLRDEGLEFFTDRDIATGELWDTKIRAAIDTTDIVLALVSQAFLSSRYCQSVEMEHFLEARRRVGTRILPIILRPCDWQAHEWLAETQARPREGRTIELDYDTKAKRDQAFLEVLQDLRQAAQAVRQGRRGA